MTSEKARENRLRRMAERQGFKLEKSRRRDPYATDYGTYRLVEIITPENALRDLRAVYAPGVAQPARVGRAADLSRWYRDPGHYGLTLDEVGAWLTGERGPIELPEQDKDEDEYDLGGES